MISLFVALMLSPDAVPVVQPVSAPTAAAVVSSSEDLKKIKCKSRPQIGSRIKQVKVCMTVAEWNNQQRNDQEQFRRDLTNGFSVSNSR